MLTMTMNRYSVVFKAQLSCKTFYGAASYSEEAMLLLDHHIKLTLSSFSSYVTKELSMVLTCLLRSNLFFLCASINVAESVKRLQHVP